MKNKRSKSLYLLLIFPAFSLTEDFSCASLGTGCPMTGCEEGVYTKTVDVELAGERTPSLVIDFGEQREKRKKSEIDKLV